MNIIIEHWGPIEKCEYNLDKSMIITYGENNIGKSYAMQAIYLVLKNIINSYNSPMYYRFIGGGISVRRKSKEDVLSTLVMDFVENKGLDYQDITEQLIKQLEELLKEELLSEIMDSFRNTFGMYEQMLETNPVITIQMEQESYCKLYFKEPNVKLILHNKPIGLKKVESEFHKSRDNKKHFDIYVYKNHINAPIELMKQKIDEMRLSFYQVFVKRISAVYFLPASRSGIYTGMSSFGPLIAQISQNRAFIRGSITIPNIPEPISDYYIKLSDIKVGQTLSFQDVTERIEKNILKGTVSFDTKKNAIVYQRQGAQDAMEMSDVSSMISEISPIIAYLKYIVRERRVPLRFVKEAGLQPPCSVIFIEEPEAHLHPKNQVLLVKEFAKLIKCNVKIVMASHSNYVFNEMNNLVISKQIGLEEYSPILMSYENGQSNTEEMSMDEFGVQDCNFADVAAELYEEREQLISDMLVNGEEL